MEQWETAEGSRYDWLYDHGYPAGGPGWPLRFAHEVTGIDFKDRTLRVLDVGCGVGVLANKYANYTGIDVSSVAISHATRRAPHGRFVVGGFSDLKQFEAEKFDAVFCFDVLEHLPEAHVEEALAALSRLNRRWTILSICTRPAGYRFENGERVHLCVKPREWWMVLLSKYFPGYYMSGLNRQKTCVLVQEARGIDCKPRQRQE